MMFFRLLANVAIVISKADVSGSFGCYCTQFSDLKIYCGSPWVSLMRIDKKEVGDDRIKYTVRNIHEFKRPENVSSLPSTVSTIKCGCGVTFLEEGESYLLAGTYDWESQNLEMRICGQFRFGRGILWIEASDDLKKFILRQKIPCPESLADII